MKKIILLLSIFYFSSSVIYSQCWNSIDVKGDTSSAQFAINSDGTLWDLTPRKEPKQIGSDSDWLNIFNSHIYHSQFGIKTDSTLWGWGYNADGGLGINHTDPVPSPILLNNEKWIDVTSSSGSTTAIKSDRTLWFWGHNMNWDYQLTPIQIGTDNDWKIVHSAYYTVKAIKNNGTLWEGNPGEPLTQVGTDNDWKYIFTNFGIKNNGTLWENGIQIGTDNDWKSIVHDHFWGAKFAIKEDKTLWYWSGSTSNPPVQMNSDQDWEQVGVNYKQEDYVMSSSGEYTYYEKHTYYAITSSGEYWQGNVGEPLTYSSANSICSSLSFKELNEIINAEVYPNPCDGVLNIKLGKYSKDVNYKIIDNQGKVVMLGVLNSVNSFVDISNISSGIYMINIENNSPIKIIRK